MKYVLITPAHNEEVFIRQTLESVCAQSALPECWVIVDDGSTDRTADIAVEYANRYAWITVVRLPVKTHRSFEAKAAAFNAGYRRVQHLEFDVIGNVDADVSFDARYMSVLMQRFTDDARLGVAGTPFLEHRYDSARDSFEGMTHVAGGVQLFRRQCFEDIGGYVSNPRGGMDWIAVTTARLRGWTTRSFPEERFYHHRPLNTANRGRWAAFVAQGAKDYYLGGAPVWQMCRVMYRSVKRPYFVGGVALGVGYAWAAVRGVHRVVTPELMQFHRAEQKLKLRAIVRALARFKSPRPQGLVVDAPRDLHPSQGNDFSRAVL